MDELLKVGIITSTHGIKGEVKVYPTTDDPARFKKLKKCYLIGNKFNKEVEVESCKFFKQMVILKFREFDSINEVEGFRQYELYVTRDNAVKLSKNEYFITDIIDSEIRDEEGNKIGVLKEVISTAANDVYVVKNEDKEILIPAIKECILNVDVDNSIITVRLMKGMVD